MRKGKELGLTAVSIGSLKVLFGKCSLVSSGDLAPTMLAYGLFYNAHFDLTSWPKNVSDC